MDSDSGQKSKAKSDTPSGWRFEEDPTNVFFRCAEDSDEAIMITDKPGVLLYVNPAWTRRYGYTKSAAVGNTPKLLRSGIQNDVFYREMWAQILDDKKGSWRGDLINKAKDGSLIPVLLSITPFRNEQNEVVGYMGLALDMTEQKDLERKVAQQDRLASIGVLASGIAHEVGTPLGVIRGRAELIKNQLEGENTRAGTGLNIIIGQIDRISRLTDSLLRFARTSDDIRIREIEILPVVEEVALLLEEKLLKYKVDCEIDVPRELKAQGDSNRLQQVLLNLVINAIHALQENTDRRREIRVRGRLVGDKVRLAVQDNGCGITPDVLKQIFDPFFTTKGVGEGTGLGLSIVHKLVTEIEGQITVESEHGIGTEFQIQLNT